MRRTRILAMVTIVILGAAYLAGDVPKRHSEMRPRGIAEGGCWSHRGCEL
jgi:hypothetical protein